MNKNEWKPGDKVRMRDNYGALKRGGVYEVDRVDPNDSHTPVRIEDDGIGYWPPRHYFDLVHDHSDWKGKPACELPEGTVCDVKALANGAISRIVMYNGETHAVDEHDSPRCIMYLDACPVIRIHKLGEQRPKTLADVPAGEVWEHFTGDCAWHDGRDFTIGITARGKPIKCWVEPSKFELEGWTRLGPIEGIKIGGVMYGEGE